MKRLAIIGTVGVPGKYGGFETLAHQLVSQLSSDFEITVYCSGKHYPKGNRPKTFNGAKLVYLPLKANGWQSIPYDILSIAHALSKADALLVLGVSGGIVFPFVRWFTKKKLIVNIDGMEWRRDKWQRWAKWFLRKSEKIAVRYSHADVTDNEMIRRYTHRYYKTVSHLIAYGGDHVLPNALTPELVKEFPFLKSPYAFKVARIEPENNIEMILQAFAGHPNKTLVLVGNWNNSAYGTQLLQQYSAYPNLHLVPPIYNQVKLDALRSNCFLYLHGHSAGGTNPSLVEAMNLGLPVMAFDIGFNRASTEDKALYFSNGKALSKLLDTTSYEDLRALATSMKEIAARRYTWEIIARQYAQLIHAFDYNYVKQSIWSDFEQASHQLLIDEGLAHLQHRSSPPKYNIP